MKIHEYNEMMAYLTRPAVNRVGFKQGTSKKYKVTNQYGTFYTDKKPGGPSTVELTTEMKERIKIFEEKTGLKYADQSVEKQHRIRAGKWKGTLPSKEKMKTQISVPEDGPPKWPNKKMEADFIKDLRKKIKFPTGKATPEHLRVSALVKKYPISERQLERLTRYYREKLNLTYAKGLASGDVTGKETATKRRNALKKYSDLTAEGWLTGNEQLHKSHMSDLYTRDVRTGTMGYAKAKINMEALDNIDAKMNSLYKKADKLLKDNPKDFAIKMDEINMKGTDLAAQSGGYKKFEAIDPITKKKFVINFSSAAQELDPTDILENKKLKDLKLSDKATIQTLKEASMENISKANMSIKNLLASADTKTIMKIRKALGCMSEGGRVGLQGGGNLLECPMAKFAQDPEGTLNAVGRAVPETRTPIMNAFKKLGMGTLKWGGRFFVGLTPIFAVAEVQNIAKRSEEGIPAGQIAADVIGTWVLPGVGGGYETYQKRKMMRDIGTPEEIAAMDKADEYKKYEMLQEDPLREVDYGEQLTKSQLTKEDQANLFNLIEKQQTTYDLQKEERKGMRKERQKKLFEDFEELGESYGYNQGGRVGFGSGSTFDAHTKREAAFKAYKDYKKSYYSSRQRYPILTFREFLQLYAEENFNQGGRVGFDKGSPKSPGRRAFIKGITALAALPIVGKYFKLGKVLERASTYTGPAIQKIKGMPEWFPSLVKKLWNEGEDVTKQVAYKERQVVKRGTLEGGEDVDMIYDMDTGDVSISVTPKKGEYSTKSGAYNKEYELDYKKGEVVEEGKYAGKTAPDDFSVSEIEGAVYPYAMDVNWEGKVTTVDDAMTDLTELEAFARDKTTKQIHKKKGTKPKDVFPDYDPGDFGRDLD